MMHSDDQFSGSNTPNQQGLFLPGTITLAKPVTEDRKDMQKLKLIRSSTDPYEAFKDDDFLYPTKEDEMPFFVRLAGEYSQGMPILPTGRCTIFCNMVCCFYFLIFGLVFLGIAQSIIEIRINYGDQCQQGQRCMIDFKVDQVMMGPIFVYYELNEFYQSHSDFAMSISPKQMRGEELTDQEYEIFCKGKQTLQELQRPNNQSVVGYIMNSKLKANPCGTAAQYIFNDSFEIYDQSAKKLLEFNFTDIAYSVDMEYKFNRHPQYMFRQWLDLEDERTVNWFNIQSLPLLRKLWGRIKNDIEIGNYTLIISNQYPKEIFGGTKTLIITTLTTFGSKNFVFGLLLCATSLVMFVSSIIIFCHFKIVENREKNEQKIHSELKLKEKQD